MNSLTLYSYYRSSASMRVRIALNLKGLAYDYKAVNLVKDGGEQFSESYRILNPSCEVPTLVHDGFAIGQSAAILDYLDQIQPEPPLFPRNPRLRAHTWQACEIINSGSQPIHNHRVDHQLERVFGATKDHIFHWTAYWIEYGLETLESFLKDKSRRFAIGDQLTAADCFLVPHLVNGRRFQLDLSRFPTLERIDRACAEIEAFQKAAMDRQPDTPA